MKWFNDLWCTLMVYGVYDYSIFLALLCYLVVDLFYGKLCASKSHLKCQVLIVIIITFIS